MPVDEQVGGVAGHSSGNALITSTNLLQHIAYLVTFLAAFIGFADPICRGGLGSQLCHVSPVAELVIEYFWFFSMLLPVVRNL